MPPEVGREPDVQSQLRSEAEWDVTSQVGGDGPGPETWSPGSPLEEELLAARRRGDQPAFLLALAGARLLLPEPAPPAEGWVVSTIANRTCVLAFTSPAAILAAGLDATATVRAAGAGELAACWPGTDVVLAVDPGLPIEVHLDVVGVQELAALAAQPATAAEARLARALAAGDLAAYLEVLMPIEVYLPLAADPEGTGLYEPGFPWLRLGADSPELAPGRPDGGEAPVVAFTSRKRLADAVGSRPWIHLSFVQLVDACPQDSPLAVDPGLEQGARLDGAVLHQLKDGVRAAIRRTTPHAGHHGDPPDDVAFGYPPG